MLGDVPREAIAGSELKDRSLPYKCRVVSRLSTGSRQLELDSRMPYHNISQDLPGYATFV